MLENLEDLLKIKKIDSLKKDELIKIVRKVQQIVKLDGFKSQEEDVSAQDLPHKAVGIVKNQVVKLRFDLDSKKARVVETPEIDTRDTKTNTMARYAAGKELDSIGSAEGKKVGK